MISQDDVRHLVPWCEIVGVLTELHDHEDVLLAQVGSITLRLPTDMASVLRPHLGEKIGVLRIDDPSRSYRLRIVNNEKPEIGAMTEMKNLPAGGHTPTEAKTTARESQYGTSDYNGLLPCYQ